MPGVYTAILFGLVAFYFFVMYPIMVATLLDSFSTTVKQKGSITDEFQTSEKINYRQWIFNLRPWLAADKDLKELQDRELKEK